jgi:hypothetical protein
VGPQRWQLLTVMLLLLLLLLTLKLTQMMDDEKYEHRWTDCFRRHVLKQKLGANVR